MDRHFDYIIVGAGSSGCVLANRLSANPTVDVLLLEAGGGDSNPLIHMPKGIGRLAFDPRHAWHYPVEQPRVAGTPSTESWVRGRGLGGSSSINGMIYIRGHPQDYEDWASAGATGWNWATMKQAFRAIEDHELGDDGNRGVGGPVHISTGKFRYPLAEAMIAAGEQMGLPRHEDLNVEDQEGVGYFPHNIKHGRRQSAAVAFLRPARSRRNLTVMTDVAVDRIIFDGKRAVGVDAGDRQFRARREIILSAGALISPVLLQRAGIGPAAALRDVGITTLVDSPDVGRRMRDHLGLSLPHRLTGARGNNWRFRGLGLAASVARYYACHTGPMATGPYEVGAFARVTPGASRPDAQLYISAFTFRRNGNANFPVQIGSVEKEPGMTVYGQLIRPTSEATVAITSPDPRAAITIEPNWLHTPQDQAAMVAMIRYIRRYVRQPALATFIGTELVPGNDVESDDQLLHTARLLSRSGTHAVRSCRMGSDAASVVDPRLRVRGVDGLRVVDCSVMPGLVAGNTNGPAMALGWRAADLIIEDAKAAL